MLYLIADMETAQAQKVDLLSVVRDFLRAGGTVVSLRGGQATDQEILTVGKEIGALVYSVGGVFLIHRRVDLALLLACDGVHLPSTGMSRRQAQQLLGRSALIGRSCHTAEEVERCEREGWAFVTLGPVFESVSKAGYGPTMTLDEFGVIARSVALPVFALGGVLPENAGSCIEIGAAGVAVVGGILGAESPFEATERYLEALAVASELESGQVG